MGLYRVPVTFQTRLDEEFQGRLRVRWSEKQHEWHVEQKVRNGLAGRPLVDDGYDDDQIRAKDGYVWILSFKHGTQFDCPLCGLTLKAVTRQATMVSCKHCQLKGYEHRWLGTHWPMDETLIQHLQELEASIDTRGQSLAKAKRMLQRQQERAILDPTVAEFEDSFRALAGIPHVGYTGTVFPGTAT